MRSNFSYLHTLRTLLLFFSFFLCPSAQGDEAADLAKELIEKAKSQPKPPKSAVKEEDFPADRINIITYKNGKGLEKDFNILKRELEKLGYRVEYVNIFQQDPAPKAYYNVFLETGSEYFFPYAKKNYLIPNPDWYTTGGDLARKFDLILCKTQDAMTIFGKWTSKIKFISFTSDDCYKPDTIKNYKLSLHFPGSSDQKGTTAVENIWLRNPQFPTLYLVKYHQSSQSVRHNIYQINGYIPGDTLNHLQHMCGLHLCPSATEGFGHTLFEGMSAESIVVTTNAPPMNEFITDKRCLVDYNDTGSQHAATTYFIDPVKFEKTISNLLKLPESELIKIGQANRKYYLENDARFKRLLAEVFPPRFKDNPVAKKPVNQLTINLICYRNGVGLDKDSDILQTELVKLGHKVNFVNFYSTSPIPKADINIFIEVVNQSFFPSAKLNYLIPNPEWYVFSFHLIPQFDKVLCKTREAERIFKQLNPNTHFISFTSKDKYLPGTKKDYRQAFHLAGKSIHKNTDAVLKAWTNNQTLPELTVVTSQGHQATPLPHIKIIDQYVADAEIADYQNTIGFHVCPSATEGFGHYLMEALSCGAVVVTTKAPPMNEFVKDERCLVDFSQTGQHALAVTYMVDPKDLEWVVNNLKNLSDDELNEIGRKNREFYLQNDQFFKKRLAEIFPPAT